MHTTVLFNERVKTWRKDPAAVCGRVEHAVVASVIMTQDIDIDDNPVKKPQSSRSHAG